MQAKQQTSLHNHQRLNDYDTFKNRNNKHIRFAFLVRTDCIEITPIEHVEIDTSLIELAEIDYAQTQNQNNFCFTNKQYPKANKENNTIQIQCSYSFPKNYVILYKEDVVYVYLDPSIGGIIDTLFYADEKNLGVISDTNSAVFTVWSPPACQIEILLFDSEQKLIITKHSLLMKPKTKGIWQRKIQKDELPEGLVFDGLYYQYKVYAYGGVRLALDPYAFSMAAYNPFGSDNIGKGAIVDMWSHKATPPDFKQTYLNSEQTANETDVILYETHVRDVSIQDSLQEDEYAGTYLACRNIIPHLKQLGMTHVQFMPIMKFCTVNDDKRTFQGLNEKNINYNWGYDPMSYFTPEGWLCTNPHNPYQRIIELRTMIQAFHNENIGLVLDVVYNHTYAVEMFEHIAPGCYYRLDNNFNISGTTGAGATLESRRLMVRKLIIDSLLHFVTYYHIDGFRFDLMSFLDHETMRQIRDKVGSAYNPNNKSDLILHGEGWLFTDLEHGQTVTEHNKAYTKSEQPSENLNISLFHDTMRDVVIGHGLSKGLIYGVMPDKTQLLSVISGGNKLFGQNIHSKINEQHPDSYHFFAHYPDECLQFLTVHDGFTLWDKINLNTSNANMETKARLMRLALAMLFTSQGKILLHGGDELFRTKPLARYDKEQDRAYTADGIITYSVPHDELGSHDTDYPQEQVGFFHENSYCSPDFTNMFRWNRLTNEFAPYSKQLIEYIKGLIAMRRSIPAFRMKESQHIFNGIEIMIFDTALQGYTSNMLTDFTKLEKLNIRFVGGPQNETMYLAGEIHPKGTDENPHTNPYKVRFDNKGIANITFSKEEIDRFDMEKWSSADELQIKLVKQAGEWETIAGAYSETGNNTIRLQGVQLHNTAQIHLGQRDYIAGDKTAPTELPIFAFSLDNTLEHDVAKHLTRAEYSKLLILWNCSDKDVRLHIPAIDQPEEWKVIVDSEHAAAVSETKVIIEEYAVFVTTKSCVVMGRLRRLVYCTDN
jgi:pullulanase